MILETSSEVFLVKNKKMPQLPVYGSNITTFRFSCTFDIFNRKVIFTDLSTYAGSSGSGIFSILGLSFCLEDQQGVELATINFSDPTKFIVPYNTNQFIVDLSSLAYTFFFQTYKISGAIKDNTGTVYQTTPVYKKVCQPVNIGDGGYVPGIFQILADCPDNVLTIKDVTPYIYDNLTPSETPIKTGTLSYPTGTINPVNFTGTPFSNNIIYTGEYRIVCNSVATYDLCDDVYSLVTYLTNNVFPISCANKMADLVCCIRETQAIAIKDCNNAKGKAAAQLLAEISVPFMNGIAAETAGMDASIEYEIIRKALKCDCGANSVRQNEFTPINPAVTSIVLGGVGGTTVPAPTVNGNTKAYNISSNIFQVVKGNTGDLAFAISLDTTTQYMTKYVVTFNYDTMANYILNAIGANPTLVSQLNSLISSTGNVDISGLNGQCIINLTQKNFVLTQHITGATLVAAIATSLATYVAPANLYASNSATVQSWLNGLGIGTFVVAVANNVITIISLGNTNSLISLQFTSPALTVPFQSTNATLISVLQSIIDYLCNLTALQSQLGATLTLWQIDYNGNITSQGFQANQSQAAYNQGVADSIYNIVQRIFLLTGITCSKIAAIFSDSPNTVFGGAGRLYGTDGISCIGFTDFQIAQLVINAVGKYSAIKTAWCAINCTSPATCPDISGINIAMSGANIAVYGLTWNTPTLTTQTVTVYYQLSGSSSWIVATNALQILANGNVSGSTPYLITGVSAGQTYNIRIVNNCGGVGFIAPITTPSGSVYSANYLLDSLLYLICGDTPVLLYSSAPFAPGVTMFTNIGLTTPVTGYNFIADTAGAIYTINNATGVVGAATGSNCNTGIGNIYRLGNATGTICNLATIQLYTNGPFVTGGILYYDSGLTSPVTGYSYVSIVDGGSIYNLNSVTGQIGAPTGINCSPLSAVLSIVGANLVANIYGGVPPYSYNFTCTPVGPCESYTINTPSGTTSGSSASTAFSVVLYSGTKYYFNFAVVDSASNSASSNTVLGPSCLAPDTLILLKDGREELLGNLEEGEELFGYSNKIERLVWQKVDKLYVINDGLLESSESHAHITAAGIVATETLKVGDMLIDKDGNNVEIKSIHILEGSFDVVDISTTTKEFIANGMRTHNKLAC